MSAIRASDIVRQCWAEYQAWCRAHPREAARWDAYIALRERPDDLAAIDQFIATLDWRPRGRIEAALRCRASQTHPPISITAARRAVCRVAVLLALADEQTPLFVRFGTEWVTDDDGRRTQIQPAELGTGTGDFVTWLRQRVIAHAEADLRHGVPVTDALEKKAPDSLDAKGAPDAVGNDVRLPAHRIGDRLHDRRTLRAFRPVTRPSSLVEQIASLPPGLSHTQAARRLETTAAYVKKVRAHLRKTRRGNPSSPTQCWETE